jgi:hypothetical protein
MSVKYKFGFVVEEMHHFLKAEGGDSFPTKMATSGLSFRILSESHIFTQSQV